MRRGGRPAQGGTPATLADRWPGHWQARPPPVGGLPPCAGLALALPAGATAGTPARRRRSLRPAAREARGRRRLRRQCARRSKLRPPAGARAAAAARSRGPGSAGGRNPQRGAPGRYAGRRVRRQSRAARPAPQAWPGWQGWPERRRPGRRGGRPQSPHLWGPGRPGAPAPRPARGRSKARPAAGGLPWPCFAEGCSRATAGGQLDQDAPQARPWPPHYPGQTCKGWTGRAAAPPPPRVGRVSARRPEGRVGRGPPAGGTRTGAPFPRPLDRQRERKEGVPTGHSLLFANKGRPTSKPDRWRLAPAPAWQSPFCRKLPAVAGRQYRGLAPVPRCIPSVRVEGLITLFP